MRESILKHPLISSDTLLMAHPSPMPPNALPAMAFAQPPAVPVPAEVVDGRTGAAKGLVGFVTHDSMKLHACLGACVLPSLAPRPIFESTKYVVVNRCHPHRIITPSHGLCGRLVAMLANISLDTCVFISWMGADYRQRLGIVWLQCNASGATAQNLCRHFQGSAWWWLIPWACMGLRLSGQVADQ
jgi:hypothetical protein